MPFSKLKFLIPAIVVASVPAVGAAQDAGAFRASAGASTLGATAEVAFRFQPNLSIRGVAAFIPSIDSDVELDGEDYDVSLEAFSAGAMLDYHTGLGGLRVSGGVFYLDPTGTGTTVDTGSITVGGTTFSTGTTTVNATITSRNEVAPALSIGYDQPLGEQWVLSGEIGGIFNGGYDVSATATNTLTAVSQADVDAEAQTIEDEINDTLGFLPYVSIMVGFRF